MPPTHMDDEEMVAPASEEQGDEELDLENLPEGDDEEEETVEQLQAKVAAEAEARKKAEELATNYKTRAEKAEKQAKAAPKAKNDDLSSTDLYALMQANVPLEDVNEVAEYAKLKGIPVAEALKSNVVKSILADNAETRRTAEASSTGAARRSGGRSSTDALLAAARAGRMPESTEDMAKLINARLEKK